MERVIVKYNGFVFAYDPRGNAYRDFKMITDVSATKEVYSKIAKLKAMHPNCDALVVRGCDLTTDQLAYLNGE